MKISIDCDGVLADFRGGFIRVINSLYPGRVDSEYHPCSWSDWRLNRKENAQVWEALKRTYEFWNNLQPYQENIAALKDFLTLPTTRSVETYIVTSRIDCGDEAAMNSTVAWLDEQGLMRSNRLSAIVVPSSRAKPTLFRLLMIKYSIDDSYETWQETHRALAGHQAYLLDREWNRNRDAFGMRVPNLAAFLEKVKEHLWRMQ